MSPQSQHEGEPWRFLARAGLALLAVIAGLYIWAEHRAHMLSALPWLVLLACPLMHLLMHRGHGNGPHGTHQHRDETGA